MAFAGFHPETLGFYEDISRHNDRDWFEAHRADYMAHVIEPAKAFINTLGPRLQTLRPDIGYADDHNGRGSFKKIHTDRRFNKDRDPYKTYAQMIFWEGPLATKKANSCVLVHIDPENIGVAAGLKYFEGPTQKVYRAWAADKDRGDTLSKAVDRARSEGHAMGDVHFKKVPRGYDPEHANAELLRHNAIYAQHKAPIPEAFFGPEFVDYCLAQFDSMVPLHQWCVELLEASAS